MDLNQLNTFIVVSETENLTRASELLFLSQPAVSAQIKILEAELGVDLFIRSTRGMKLTIAGQSLKQDALRTLEAAKDILSNAKKFYGQNELSGDCFIGSVSEPTILRLPEMLSFLIRVHPNLSLHISLSVSGVIVENLLANKLHGGYVIGEVNDSRIISIPIKPINLCIVGPYQWKDKIINADWDQLSKLPWISMSPKCSFNKMTTDMFARNKLKPTSIVTVEQESTSRKLVASGMGLTLMREDVALEAAIKQELVIWTKEKVQSHLYFIYSKQEENTPMIQALCQSIYSIWKG